MAQLRCFRAAAGGISREWRRGGGELTRQGLVRLWEGMSYIDRTVRRRLAVLRGIRTTIHFPALLNHQYQAESHSGASIKEAAYRAVRIAARRAAISVRSGDWVPSPGKTVAVISSVPPGSLVPPRATPALDPPRPLERISEAAKHAECSPSPAQNPPPSPTSLNQLVHSLHHHQHLPEILPKTLQHDHQDDDDYRQGHEAGPARAQPRS